MIGGDRDGCDALEPVLAANASRRFLLHAQLLDAAIAAGTGDLGNAAIIATIRHRPPPAAL